MAKTYSIMHSISSEYYNIWDKRLGIPVILLGAATASSIFTTSTKKDTINIWSYINGGMVLLMTGISGISKFIGTNEKQAKHTIASFKYTEISMNIDTLLSFPRNDRQEQPRQFINDIKLNILQVRENSPDLPTWIVSNYIKNIDKSLTNTHTKVNRNKQSTNLTNSTELPDLYTNIQQINEWNNISYKNSKSSTPPEKIITVQPHIEKINVEEHNLNNSTCSNVKNKVEVSEMENKLNEKNVIIRINEDHYIYNDLHVSSNDIDKKIEHISTKLQYHNQESDTESEND